MDCLYGSLYSSMNCLFSSMNCLYSSMDCLLDLPCAGWKAVDR